MPKVSVIIPAYNAGKFLDKCLQSILNQTVKDFEIIIINDGSKDNTEEIALNYKAKYPDIFKVQSVKNGGQGRARNIGIGLSKGEYISFVDADDYIREDMFQLMLAKAEKEDADLVTCNYYYGNTTTGYDEIIPKVPKNQKDMFIDPDVSPCNKIYRANIVRDNADIRFLEGMFYEDIYFYFTLIPYVKTIASVQEPLYYYEIHGNSSVHGIQDKRVLHIFKVMNSVVGYFEKKGLSDKFHKEIEYEYAKILLCSSMGRICRLTDRKIRKAAMNQTLRELKRKFPNYRKNPYMQHGVKCFYMRHVSRWNISVCALLMDKLHIHQK